MANLEADYWRGRFVQVEETSHKTALERLDALDVAYREAGREIEREMSVWYQRFATNNGITLREAKQWLNAGELKEFKWSVQDYIKHGQENNLSGAWMKELENASARFHVSRLQALQISGQQVVEKLFGGQLDGIDATMRQSYLTGYYHGAFEIQKGLGFGWNIGRIDDRALDRVINRPWTMDGRNFSDRIWTNKAALTAELQKQLTQNMMLGKSPEDSIQAIMKKFNVSHHQAERLVVTESAYFSSLSQQECYRDLGIENYQIVATLDERTSDICQSMDGQTFSVKDYEPGVTAPPFHPYCRTATCPYYADMKGVGERAARDPETGKTYYVPKNMTYPEWKKTFATGEAAEPPKAGTVLPINYSCSLAQKFGQPYYDALHQRVVNCPDQNLAKVWKQYEDQIDVGDANYSGPEHCFGSTIYVNGTRDGKGSTWQNPYQTTFHESGHAIDSLARSKGTGTIGRHYSSTYQNGLFPQTIKDEADGLVSALDHKMKAEFKAHAGDYDWLHQHGYISDWNYNWFHKYGNWVGGTPKYSKSMAYSALEKEIKALAPLAKADLSDILEGATGGKISIGFGHGKTYWAQRTFGGVSEGLATEAFAEMIDSTMTCPESLATIQKYLPKSYELFKKMIEELLP